MGGVGGPCDFSVSPSPFDLDFGTLDFGLWTSDLGLTIGLKSAPNVLLWGLLMVLNGPQMPPK